jgi:hypothetical protein
MTARQSIADVAREMMRGIDENPRANYTAGDVKSMLNRFAGFGEAVSSCREPVAVVDLRRGDVFIHKLVGGKVRPWIVLRVSGEFVSAVAMSKSGSARGMIPSQCRLWPDQFIGVTLSAIPFDEAVQEVTRPYTNLPHLGEIERACLESFGAVPAPKAAISVADIRARLHAVGA